MVPAPASRRERRRRCTTLILSIFASLLLTLPALGETDEPTPAEGDADLGKAEASGADEPEDDAPGLPVIVVEEVNITAARSERSVHEVPGNVTVIDRETIDRSSARNVPELLRREAGIFVTNRSTNREGYTAEGAKEVR